jgi:hypothetical protein
MYRYSVFIDEKAILGHFLIFISIHTAAHKSIPLLYFDFAFLPKQWHYEPLTGAQYATINFGRTNLPLTFTIETATIVNFMILVCAIAAWKNNAFLEFAIKLCMVAVNYQVI